MMKRPLIAYERIKTIEPLDINKHNDAIMLNNAITVNCKVNKSIVIQVMETGIYKITALANFDRNSLAQSSCSLSLNDIFCMSLAMNGSDGKSITIEGLDIRLDIGFYTLSVDFVKRGMELEQIFFNKSLV